MKEQPQDIVNTLVLELLLKFKPKPDKVESLGFWLDNCKQVWLDQLGDYIDKSGKRRIGKLLRKKITHVQCENELPTEEAEKFKEIRN